MICAARRTILLTDSSKLGHRGFIKVAPLTAVQTIITDTDLPAEIRAEVERLKVEVVLV